MNISGSKENEQQQLLSSAMGMNLTSGTSTESFRPINSPPSTESTVHLSVSVPPLQNLSGDDRNDEFQTSAPNFDTLVYVEDEIANGSLSPPKLKRF